MRPEARHGALAMLLLVAAAAPSGSLQAEEADSSLSGFVKPPAATARGQAVTLQEWDRRLRATDCASVQPASGDVGCFGPQVLRDADAALLAAARGARWAEALQLLKTGQAGANADDGMGGNVLVLAARAAQDELVRELLKRGANTERLGEDGFTPLGAAAFAGHRSTVRLLLRAGVDARRWGSTGQSPLHLAALAGQVPVLDEMLRAGVAIELLNRQRESALDVAAAAAQQEVMQRLIQDGANLDLAGRR